MPKAMAKQLASRFFKRPILDWQEVDRPGGWCYPRTGELAMAELGTKPIPGGGGRTYKGEARLPDGGPRGSGKGPVGL